MTNTEKEQIIARMIDEGRGQELADAMVEPIRCGGVEYHDGVAYIWLGDCEYPYEEFLKAHEENRHHFPVEWCKSYKEAHGKDLVTGPATVVIE